MGSAMHDRLASTLGVFAMTDEMPGAQAAEFARQVESLGYSALWVPEAVGRDPFALIAHLASATTTLGFATGIANIFNRHPGAMKQAAMTLAEQSEGRFALGLGISHAPIVEGLRGLDYSRPLSQMRAYLDAMDASPYMGPEPSQSPPRLLAALGPKMLALAGDATDGAHPYWTTPEHTAQAREILGPDKLLCVEQKLVLSTDADAARAAARAELEFYLGLPNYRNSWKRMGYSDDQIDARGDDFVDALVGWGDEDALRARVQAHHDAGATHVCIQPVSVDALRTPDMAVLEALAPAG